MTKILSYLSVILGVAVYILFSLYDNAKDKISALETQKNALEGNIKFLKEDIHETNKRILAADKRAAELEELARNSKDDIWHHRFDNNDPIIVRLRQD